MNCLCCWKKLQTVEDENRGWHKSCVRHFFGSDRIPELDLDEELDVNEETDESAEETALETEDAEAEEPVEE